MVENSHRNLKTKALSVQTTNKIRTMSVFDIEEAVLKWIKQECIYFGSISKNTIRGFYFSVWRHRIQVLKGMVKHLVNFKRECL